MNFSYGKPLGDNDRHMEHPISLARNEHILPGIFSSGIVITKTTNFSYGKPLGDNDHHTERPISQARHEHILPSIFSSGIIST